MCDYVIKKSEIISFWKSNNRGDINQQKEAVLNFLLERFKISSTEENRVALKKGLNKSFFNNYKKRFDLLPKNSRNIESFERVYDKWLEKEYHFKLSNIESEIGSDTPLSQEFEFGRPEVPYELACKKTKYNRNIASAKAISNEELCDIAKKKMKLEGNKSGSKLIDSVFKHDSAHHLLKVVTMSTKNEMTKMSSEEALELIIATNMTKNTYNEMRIRAQMHKHDIYPEYKKIISAKKEAYPQNVYITETECIVPLQDLLEHTVKRLCSFLNLIFDDATDTRLVLFIKYGFDGTNANRYKQKSAEKSSALDYIFCSSLVPLRLVNKSTNEIYWSNQAPSSTRFCRPIKILYQKETDELIKREEADLQQQIDNLSGVEVSGCKVEFQMMLTMIDGKVCNAINDTSSQRCFVCNTAISQLNKINDIIDSPIQESALKYGFSVLHAYIRFMELVLHVSYRMQLKIWRVPKDKVSVIAVRKKEIQDGLYEELGIFVDAPKQGSGNTNDGNTARRFFNNVDVVARVTGFDEELLQRFKVILSVVSSCYTIDKIAYKQYAKDTAMRYVHLYDWYYMPPSLHVVLLHGHKIMDSLFLPIGMLSEEAQECNNKNLKRFRDRFSRKISRVAVNTDTFNRLLLYSDPYLSMLHSSPKKEKKHRKLTSEMKSLIIMDENYVKSNDSDSETDYEDISMELEDT